MLEVLVLLVLPVVVVAVVVVAVVCGVVVFVPESEEYDRFFFIAIIFKDPKKIYHYYSKLCLRYLYYLCFQW